MLPEKISPWQLASVNPISQGATNQEGCIISPNDIPTPPPSSPICSPIETCHEEVEEDQLYQLDHHFWVCVCVCVCMCDLKECLYLYTSREEPCGRPQTFDTDSHVPPKIKYKCTRIIHQWKNDVFTGRQSVQLCTSTCILPS